MQHMRKSHLFTILGVLLLASACTKEKPLVEAILHAKCRNCIVSYAAGVAQSKKDTLRGRVDAASGDTVPEEGQWTVHLKDGDNIFLKACRLQQDTAMGNIDLWVNGGIAPMEVHADTTHHCAEINQAAHAQ